MMSVSAHPDDRPDAVPRSGGRTFVLLFLTQWLAWAAMVPPMWVLGLEMMDDFESAVVFAIVFDLLYLPFPLLAPFAGVLTDRWGQRRVLLLSNVGMLATLVAVTTLLLTDTLGTWSAVATLLALPTLKALQLPALESVVPLLVAKRHIARANGPRMLLTATGVIVGSVFALTALSTFDDAAIMALGCAPVVLAILVVALVRIPRAPWPEDAGPRSARADLAQAWSYLRTRPGLVPVLAFLGVVTCVIACVEQGTGRLVTGFGSDADLDTVFLAGLVGMLVSSVVMTIWGRPRRLVRGMLGGGLVFAVGLVVSGLRPDTVLVAAAAFVALGSTPIIIGTIHTVLHTKVEPHLLGRTMGMKNALISYTHMTGNIGVILLGLAVLDGWSPGSTLAALVGRGDGRGYAVLMVAIGAAVAVAAVVGLRHGGLRRLEHDLPDVTPADLVAARTAEPVAVPGPAQH